LHTTVRYTNSSTNRNLNALVRMIQHENVRRVILFASPTELNADTSPTDGPSANFPLVAALAEFEIPDVLTFCIVFGGVFLTAARLPRYREISSLLDAAVLSSKVFYSNKRAPFTSSFLPQEAAAKLLNLGPFKMFDETTRSRYFALLSIVAEGAF